MRKYQHIFKMSLPIDLDDEDLLRVKIYTTTNSIEFDENKENAKERSGLILQRIGFQFKKGLIMNIISQLSHLTDDQIDQLELDKELISVKETKQELEKLLYQS